MDLSLYVQVDLVVLYGVFLTESVIVKCTLEYIAMLLSTSCLCVYCKHVSLQAPLPNEHQNEEQATYKKHDDLVLCTYHFSL